AGHVHGGGAGRGPDVGMQVAAANAVASHLDHDLAGGGRRLGHIVDADVPGTVVDGGLHAGLPQESSRAVAEPVTTGVPSWLVVVTDTSTRCLPSSSLRASTVAVAVNVSPGHTWFTKRTPYRVRRSGPNQSVMSRP